MKKIGKLLLLLSLLVLMAVAVTACSGSGGELSVKENGMPQLVHVLGEELDLSNGVLLLTRGDKSEEIAMNAEGVTVSGYDKNTLGEQTVTITYGGSQTTVKVTVVPRMIVEGYTADYLKGDTLDTSKGNVKITRNDGTTYTVSLKSDKIAVEGFNSAAAGALSLKVKYTNGDAVYECDIAATVYEIENVTFTAPTKTSYNSHDGALDVSGGYFTLKGNGGKITKQVNLTADMVSGFDIAAVNETNSPYTQQLTATYNSSWTGSYEVKLTYTNISLFKKNAVGFLVHDWMGEVEPTIDDEDGMLALELMTKYLDMSPAERRFITSSETLAVARAAMTYGFNEWADEVQKYNGAFAIEYGQLVLKCESPEAVEAAIDGLGDKNSSLYTLSPILIKLMEEFEEEQVNSMYLFSDYPVLPNEIYADLSLLFEYMLELDVKFDAIPENLDKTQLAEYADEIEAAYEFIVNSGFLDPAYSDIFYYVSTWREGDDAYDLLYRYYYEVKDIDVNALANLATVCLPTELREVYSYISMAMDQVEMLASYMEFDTSQFMYYYYMASTLADELRTSEDEMLSVLYTQLPLNGLMGMDYTYVFLFDDLLDYVRTGENGFYYYSGAMLGIEEYQALLDKYMEIVMNMFADESYEGSAVYNTDVDEMFSMYLGLTPAQQFYFLGMLNTFYSMNVPPLAFDSGEEYADFTCVFVQIVNEYFDGVFTTDAAKGAYRDLVAAIELYAQRYTNTSWKEAFDARIQSINAVYGEIMAGADAEPFSNYLLNAYNEYLMIYNKYHSDEKAEVDLGDWADDFVELKEAMLSVELASQLLQGGLPMYSLYLSAFERVQAIVDRIMTAPDDIIEAYLHAELYCINEFSYMLDPDAPEVMPEEEKIYWSFDYVVSLFRETYIKALMSFNGESVYDYYVFANMSKFVDSSYDVIWKYLYTEEGAVTEFDKEKVLAAIKNFSDLDVVAQTLFVLMESEQGYYYIAISDFITNEYSELVANAAIKTLELEQAYMLYKSIGDEESLNDLERLLGEAKALYEEVQLDAEAKLAFADFEYIYQLNIEKCEQAVADAEAQDSAA